MKNRIRQYNLVEVILALGVVAIGVVSVMALFPIGASATRDASMETYAATVADEMLQFVRYQLKQGSNSTWLDIVGNKTDDGILKGMRPTDMSDEDVEKLFDVKRADLTDAEKWSQTSTLFDGNLGKNNTIFQYEGNPQLFQLIAHHNGSSVEMKDESFDENVDFRAIAYIWKEKMILDATKDMPDSTELDDTTTGLKVPFSVGARIIVRVTWPAELPYSARQKADYVLEVFNGNQQ